jgi:hypothetical protein
MLFWAVVSDSTEEAVELLTSREEAEAPDQASVLRVEKVGFRTGTAN